MVGAQGAESALMRFLNRSHAAMMVLSTTWSPSLDLPSACAPNEALPTLLTPSTTDRRDVKPHRTFSSAFDNASDNICI